MTTNTLLRRASEGTGTTLRPGLSSLCAANFPTFSGISPGEEDTRRAADASGGDRSTAWSVTASGDTVWDRRWNDADPARTAQIDAVSCHL